MMMIAAHLLGRDQDMCHQGYHYLLSVRRMRILDMLRYGFSDCYYIALPSYSNTSCMYGACVAIGVVM